MCVFFVAMQETAYERRISDGSSDVCSSDLQMDLAHMVEREIGQVGERREAVVRGRHEHVVDVEQQAASAAPDEIAQEIRLAHRRLAHDEIGRRVLDQDRATDRLQSEEHTSELQSLMRISYAVFCLKKKKI